MRGASPPTPNNHRIPRNRFSETPVQDARSIPPPSSHDINSYAILISGNIALHRTIPSFPWGGEILGNSRKIHINFLRPRTLFCNDPPTFTRAVHGECRGARRTAREKSGSVESPGDFSARTCLRHGGFRFLGGNACSAHLPPRLPTLLHICVDSLPAWGANYQENEKRKVPPLGALDTKRL